MVQYLPAVKLAQALCSAAVDAEQAQDPESAYEYRALAKDLLTIEDPTAESSIAAMCEAIQTVSCYE